MSPNASHWVRPGLSSAASLMTTLLISFDQEVLNQQLNLVTPEYPFFESPWAAARRRGRRGGRPPAIDPETIDQIVAALDGGSSKSGVCRTFRVARSTLNDTLERIGWNGAAQHGSTKLKPKAQRPREQERRRRLSREERERASSLRQCLGVEVGVRRSAAQIGEQLPAYDRKNGRTGELVSKITSSFVAEGLAELAPGPRGGAGWSLTKKGKALIDKVYATGSFEDSA